MPPPKKYDKKTQARSVRMYQERMMDGNISQLKAREEVGELLGINQATLRNWIRRDVGEGVASEGDVSPVIQSSEGGYRIIDRSLLSDQVYAAVRGQIIDHSLTPGSRVVESDIARQVGVSQAPVRDALRRLAHEGLVIQFARRGTFVAGISKQEARQTYLVRANLESLAAQEFNVHATQTDIRHLARLVELMRNSAESDDIAALVEQDIEFHRTVWAGSRNVLLPRIWPMIEGSMRRLTPISNRLYFPDLLAVATTHEPLLEAFQQRDDRAADLSRQHVLAVWEHIDHVNNGNRTSL